MTKIGKSLAVAAAVLALGVGAAFAQGAAPAGAPANTPAAAGPAGYGYGPMGYRGSPAGGWRGGPGMMGAWGNGGPSSGWFHNMIAWCAGGRG